MIKHIVMVKMAEEADGRSAKENLEIFKAKLEALPGLIDEIVGYEVGVDILSGPNSYDLVLVSEFESLETLKTYIAHEEHQKVVEFMKVVDTPLP
jgi:heme-degrading monooxygenase HmoA